MSMRTGAFVLKIVGLSLLLVTVLLRIGLLRDVGGPATPESLAWQARMGNILLILALAAYAAGMTLSFLLRAKRRRTKGFPVEQIEQTPEQKEHP